jgi:hypothetical protein
MKSTRTKRMQTISGRCFMSIRSLQACLRFALLRVRFGDACRTSDSSRRVVSSFTKLNSQKSENMLHRGNSSCLMVLSLSLSLSIALSVQIFVSTANDLGIDSKFVISSLLTILSLRTFLMQKVFVERERACAENKKNTKIRSR